MESAIDSRLQCPRTLPSRAPEGYRPPYPIWVGRVGQDVTAVAMGYFGVQYRGEEHRAAAWDVLWAITDGFGLDGGPGAWDLTHHVDAHGYDTLVAAGYWRDARVCERWLARPEIAGWWDADERLSSPVGVFREILAPGVDRFETLYAVTEGLPGIGGVLDDISGQVVEHAYWGSMRDRIARSQTDRMRGTGALRAVGGAIAGGRVVVRGHENVALIRSGQDWTGISARERDIYLGSIEPALREAMDFLRDRGREIGCYSNRYVRNVAADGAALDTTYAISYWRSLDLLERWAELHPTHLNVFVALVSQAEHVASLRLHHEVAVLDADSQYYEYANCHPATGLLRDAVASA